MTELAPGAVTTADLYRELVGLRTDITKALERLAVIDAKSQDTEARHNDHELRLRSLEAFKWKLAGACIALSVFSGGAAGWIALAIHH